MLCKALVVGFGYGSDEEKEATGTGTDEWESAAEEAGAYTRSPLSTT